MADAGRAGDLSSSGATTEGQAGYLREFKIRYLCLDNWIKAAFSLGHSVKSSVYRFLIYLSLYGLQPTLYLCQLLILTQLILFDSSGPMGSKSIKEDEQADSDQQ